MYVTDKCARTIRLIARITKLIAVYSINNTLHHMEKEISYAAVDGRRIDRQDFSVYLATES